MEKPDSISAAAIESQLIGIEEDYHHGMKDRVSQWLANSNDGEVDLDDVDYELSSKEQGEKILESLRQKKLKWSIEDKDNGTDADVESDNELESTKL
uniref:Uncharacterized protein n=1 Tax=Arion vulgaris TaxID=1028688 RepID=A0A0B6ZR50_9EUPU